MEEVFCIHQTLYSNKNGNYDKYNALRFSLRKKVSKKFVLNLKILFYTFQGQMCKDYPEFSPILCYTGDLIDTGYQKNKL